MPEFSSRTTAFALSPEPRAPSQSEFFRSLLEGHGERLGVFALKGEAKAWAGSIRAQVPALRQPGAVEEHPLDARMIVEVFRVASGRRRAAQ